MSLIVLLAAVAGITVLSRLAPMLLPAPQGRLAGVVARLPAPLFAALAALSLAPSSGTRVELPVVAGVLGALLVWRVRSLLVTLAAGLAGYLVATALLS